MADSLLSEIGQDLRKALHIANIVLDDATKVAAISEPIVDIAFPEVAILFNTTVGLAQTAEAIFGGPGTGAAKLELLAKSLLPAIASWSKTNNINWTGDAQTAFASKVVDAFNMIPASTPPTPKG
jgi:hypothetical protein